MQITTALEDFGDAELYWHVVLGYDTGDRVLGIAAQWRATRAVLVGGRVGGLPLTPDMVITMAGPQEPGRYHINIAAQRETAIGAAEAMLVDQGRGAA